MSSGDDASAAGGINRITPMRFIVGFGIVSALADVVYEGARSIIGPYLGSLGASAAAIGLITGAGEAAALVLRLFTGRLADRLGRPGPQTVLGYALTAVCVPLLAVAGGLTAAGLLYNGERVGKAVRTPARDSMLALARLRRMAPDPAAWEPAAQVAEQKRLRVEAGLPRQFWQYAAFSAATMLGFSTWAVLAFHLTSRHLVPVAVVPILYALAMAAASIAAVVFGRLYDRVGLRGLVALPLLAAAVPLLSFSSTIVFIVAGTIVWGAGMGIHDSTMRAAVADFVPPRRRGAGYGTFTAIYGLAWLVGAAAIGWLYGRS